MTVGELKKALEEFDDSLLVITRGPACFCGDAVDCESVGELLVIPRKVGVTQTYGDPDYCHPDEKRIRVVQVS